MAAANGVSHATATTSGRDLRALLRDLITVEHVRGGLIVAPDGLAATLGRELEVRGPRLRRGSFLMANFAAGDGTVFLGGTPVGFILLLADSEANRERIRHAMRGAIDAVRQAWKR